MRMQRRNHVGRSCFDGTHGCKKEDEMEGGNESANH
jgi:hypothetical protein